MLGKKILVIGAHGQIGRSICKCLENEYEVFKADLSSEIVDSNEITLDINNEKDVKALLERFRFDIIINSAYPRNKSYGSEVEDVTYSNFVENISMNLGGYFNVMKYAGVVAKESDKSHLVLSLGSVYGTMAPRFEIYDDLAMTMPVEYAAIKAGLINMSRYFAKYYKKRNIRYNTVSPGGVALSQPMQFRRAYEQYCGTIGLLDANQVASVCKFLVSEDAVAINGQDLIVDDGFVL